MEKMSSSLSQQGSSTRPPSPCSRGWFRR
jgi:hypothetical protein